MRGVLALCRWLLQAFVLPAVLSLLLTLPALLPPRTAHAADAPLLAADPAIEARMQVIAAELRCLVCQNQTIADSNAPLAADLRQQVREMLRSGQSQQQIIDYMTARYGDFVLYRPPVRPATALLWFGPLALLAAGLLVLTLVLRQRARMAPERFEPDPDDAA